ncbi:MAG: hypothetical protein ACO3FE_10935, partial [Planctomycetaceae bacterium]
FFSRILLPGFPELKRGPDPLHGLVLPRWFWWRTESCASRLRIQNHTLRDCLEGSSGAAERIESFGGIEQ